MTAFGIFALRYDHDDIIVMRWRESFAPEARDGGGWAMFTEQPTHALRFASREDATVYLHIVPSTRPIRADGKPNMPLRAFTVDIRQLPDA